MAGPQQPLIPIPFDFSLLKPLNTPEGLQSGQTSFTSKDSHISCTVKLYGSAGSDQTEVDAVTPSLWYSCQCAILGYSYVDSGGTLQRVPPLQHWTITNCWAVQITNAVGELFDGTILPISLAGLGSAPQYKYIRFTIDFGLLPFDPLTNSQLGSNPEFYRYTSYQSETHFEFLTRKQGQMVFVENQSSTVGPPLFGVFGVTIGTPVGNEYKVPVQKTTLNFIWHAVPEAYLCETESAFAIVYPKLADAIATLNNAEFLSQDIGTWLMMPYKPTRYPSILQMPPSSSSSYNYQYFQVDIAFQFIYFQPECGAMSPIQQGWNNLPYFQPDLPTVGGQPQPVLWYRATLTNPNGTANPNGTPLFQLSTFADMFTFWDS